MFGIFSEDSLNYHLIMEGFYYDAKIEHITEIVKNNLYFAVLEGENNKIIKNNHDTYYFSIDDELVYINYYFDFGPLNISCLYKYCCKLNGFLQYSQGMKRVVHYTTSNPIKRVNAAFLMGCFSIIYLKMEPKDIYRALLNAGGSFKPFVDASQGISQYTIRLLDCFHAVEKALAFNFFNFADFNVNEYDLHDKLQHGDMNWLVPRKFIAFIGPSDSAFMNGHPPEFYIKYFLDNDIKTVIRLNNKLYDASTFTQVGIEHHELFFLDGTVPTKQILLQFLDISEHARAAIAVHCKAGLGRTGSLIGAYIVKHYQMTAREAIAWMRICRPGSVIGQQQGWLEKIEGWLWRQGSQYRLQHFGEGDKIPHHKYGIYSKQWPKDREKVIRQVQRRRLETQQANCSRVRPVVESSSILDSSVQSLGRCSCTPKKSSMKPRNFNQKPILVTEKDEENRKISKLLNKTQKNALVGNRGSNKSYSEAKDIDRIQDVTNADQQYQEEIPCSRIKSKQQRLVNTFKYKDYDEENPTNRPNDIKEKRYVNTAPAYEFYDQEGRNKLDFSDDFHEIRTSHMKPKRRNQSETREIMGENRPAARIQRRFVENLEQTQGDKLNEIKAQRLASYIESEGSANKIKQVKPRRRLTNVTNVDMYNKPKASTSKKHELETMFSLKRSQFEQNLGVYSSRT